MQIFFHRLSLECSQIDKVVATISFSLCICGMRMMIIFIEFSDAIAAMKRESLFSRNDNDGVQKWLRTTISDENYYDYGVHWNASIILGAGKFARGFLWAHEGEDKLLINIHKKLAWRDSNLRFRTIQLTFFAPSKW